MRLDLLLVVPPSGKQVYQNLSKELTAKENPVWAGLIAHYMAARGYGVEILDAEAMDESVERTAYAIIAANPRLVVFCVYGHQPSASTQCMPAASAVAKKFNELRAYYSMDTRSMVIGTHASALPKKTVSEEPFDLVCQGEGVHAIELTVQALREQAIVTPIDGLWQKIPVVMPWRAAKNIEDLDKTLPAQAFGLMPMRKYRPHNWHVFGVEGGGYASVQTSLGCPFKCSFCCINAPFGGPGIRYWSAKSVVEQILVLVADYGITNIKIPDEMFVLNPRHVTSICQMIIDAGLAGILNMWAYARIDTVNNQKLLDLMREAGFRWLGIGIESGSKHVRDGVDKGRFNEDDIVVAVEKVRFAGINVAANYIFGLPDDTLNSMRETFNLALDLNTEWANFYCAMAYPGSALHSLATQKGWRLPEDPDGPGWIGYSQHSYHSMPLRTETLTYEEVLDFRDNAFMEYFSRSAYRNNIKRIFGDTAVEQVEAMLKYGKPQRAHRDYEQ